MNTLYFSIRDRAIRLSRIANIFALTLALGACATTAPYDYTAFKEYRPVSMLVLPPVNESPEINATYGVLAQITMPLAEGGYYVVPVSLMDETFRQNGLNNASEIHDITTKKLYEIFGADAAIYITIKKYGTSYTVINSESTVTVEGRVIGLRTGQTLWSGGATASSRESEGSNQGGLVGLLVSAVVKQVVGNATDASFNYAGIASSRLLSPRKNGLLYGPRSPHYKQDATN